MAEQPAPKRAQKTAPKTSEPPAEKKAWVSVTLSAYPGVDGTQKWCKPGDVITDAADGWPPDQVVRDGWIRPAEAEKEK